MGKVKRDDYDGYASMISRLGSTLERLEQQGLESHLFCRGELILKVYQWFILRGLDLDEELRLWEQQNWLLSIYAPKLQTQIVAISPLGEILPGTSRAFCYGLLLSRGKPFLQFFWDSSTESERERWSESIAFALADCHLSAPKQVASAADRRGALIEQIETVLTIIDSLQENIKRLPVAHDRILNAVRSLLHSDQFDPLVTRRVSHGDPNLSNIVLTTEGDIQLIDPGPALLTGIGIENADKWQLDTWWDVAVMSKSFLEYGGSHSRSKFLQAYSERAGVSEISSLLNFQYWLVLYYLMVVAICLRRWEDFNAESNPFARFIRSKRITLNDYLSHFFFEVLAQLDLSSHYDRRDTDVKDLFG